MLKALLKLAQQGDINMSVRAAQGENPVMTIIVLPVAKPGQDPVLATPVRLAGTLAELEEGFTAALERLTGTRATLIEQLEATETILKNAQVASAKKGADALKGGKKPGAPVPVKAAGAAPAAASAASATSAESDDDEAAEEDTPLASQAAAAGANSAPAVGNLFGE